MGRIVHSAKALMQGIFDMTMLTHTRSGIEPAAYSSVGHDTAGAEAAQARLAKIKRFCISALAVAAAGCALVAIMALKIAVYFPRFIQH